MSIGTPYKRAALADQYDTIVIGSGIGGLAAASMLARHRKERVLVLERHYTAGGFTHSFRRPGFDWDVGVHYIGEVNREGSLLRRLFDHLSDGELAWHDMGEVYDRIRIGDRTFDLVKGERELRAKLVAEFPHERVGIDRYFDLVRKVNRASQLYFAEKVLPSKVAALVGPALRYPTLRHARRTTGEVVNGLVSDPELRGLLTAQWGDYGLPPSKSSFLIHAMVAKHYLKGAAYPVGGASRIAETIIPSIERAGGAVVVRAEVANIVIERGRAVGVRLVDGRTVHAARVISDAGAAITYGQLVPEAHRPVSVDSRGVSGIAPSIAHLSLYVGLEGTSEELGLPHHNVWIYPSADHDANYDRMVARDDGPMPAAFLSFASARDPDFQRRHPGHATAEVVTLAPDRWFAAWNGTQWGRRGDDYDARKRELEERLLAILFGELPHLRGKVIHTELSTPVSTSHFAGHPHGEIYGLAHDPARFDSRWLRPETPIPGLYLAGSDVCSAGVAGALMGGVLCASAAIGRNLLTAVDVAPPRPERARAEGPRATL
jgi:all-trans-retinol 13,14-reductase